MTVRASQIAAFLGQPLVGQDLEIERVGPASGPSPGSLVFLQPGHPDWLDAINGQSQVFALVAPEYAGRLTAAHIITTNPRRDYALVVQQFLVRTGPSGVADTAAVAATAQLGRGVSVGDFTVIGHGVKIGDGTEIRDHVVIRDGCVIGSHCLIKSHAVIGEEGFGFELGDDGTPIRMPHLGRVVIDDHVEVGASTIIVRGTIGNTMLAAGVKVDDQVLIAHNVTIGLNTMIAGGSCLGGSATIGRNVWIGLGVKVSDHVDVGDGTVVGIGSVVVRSAPAGVTVAGHPSRVLRGTLPQASPPQEG